MSSNDIGTHISGRRRWVSHLLIISIALILSIIIVLFFFSSGAISR